NRFDDGTLPAIDAWYGADSPDPASVKGLKSELIDSSGKPGDRFRPGDQLRLRISADEPMYFQYVLVNSDGRIARQSKVDAYEPSNEPLDVRVTAAGGLSDEPGKARLIVFVSPRRFLPA